MKAAGIDPVIALRDESFAFAANDPTSSASCGRDARTTMAKYLVDKKSRANYGARVSRAGRTRFSILGLK